MPIDNQVFEQHLRDDLNTKIAARNEATERVASMGKFREVNDELLAASKVLRMNALRHAGCAVCDSWNGSEPA
jgi:hypothetical protein